MENFLPSQLPFLWCLDEWVKFLLSPPSKAAYVAMLFLILMCSLIFYTENWVLVFPTLPVSLSLFFHIYLWTRGSSEKNVCFHILSWFFYYILLQRRLVSQHFLFAGCRSPWWYSEDQTRNWSWAFWWRPKLGSWRNQCEFWSNFKRPFFPYLFQQRWLLLLKTSDALEYIIVPCLRSKFKLALHWN